MRLALLALLDPSQLQDGFVSWVKSIAELSLGEVISLDGKSARRSYDQGNGKGAIHMVSAWASENQLVLGQVKVADKSNEITAIPKLLKLLDVSGCIVTIDAMGTQKEIAKQIIDQDADYVLSLKGNQVNLHQDVEQFLTGLLKSASTRLNMKPIKRLTKAMVALKLGATGYLVTLSI